MAFTHLQSVSLPQKHISGHLNHLHTPLDRDFMVILVLILTEA